MTDDFNEKDIRAELKRLDEKTGLHGADLKIIYGRAKSYLGYFSYKDENDLKFYFSDLYFEDPRFPVEAKINVIRHEYAHYMDYMLHGRSNHGQLWKRCCDKIGVSSIRCYNPELSEYYNMKHEKEDETNQLYDLYCIGEEILHPVFGKGTITEIIGSGTKRNAVVKFENSVTKTLAISWIAEKCR